MDITKQLAQELSLRETQVRQTIALLDEGNTIPLLPATARKPQES